MLESDEYFLHGGIIRSRIQPPDYYVTLKECSFITKEVLTMLYNTAATTHMELLSTWNVASPEMCSGWA